MVIRMLFCSEKEEQNEFVKIRGRQTNGDYYMGVNGIDFISHMLLVPSRIRHSG